MAHAALTQDTNSAVGKPSHLDHVQTPGIVVTPRYRFMTFGNGGSRNSL
jgi:hypothetical protein